MLNELSRVFESFIRNIDGGAGRRLRRWYYSKRLGRCGSNVVIETGVFFQNPRSIFIGDNVWIDKYVLLISGPFVPGKRKYARKDNSNYTGAAGDLVVGNGVHLAPFSLVQAHGGVQIGNNVTIASGAKVYSLSHHHRNISDKSDTKRYSFSTMAPDEDQFLILSPVVIQNNCAVGLNAVVLPGTTIRSGSWLGVLSYVTPGDTEMNAVYQSVRAHKKD
jgi:acetyltransferase-like isoleucine patch superfamily enzyme